MELLVYIDEQPVYTLGVVNHAHVYGNGMIGKHMYTLFTMRGLARRVQQCCVFDCQNVDAAESL